MDYRKSITIDQQVCGGKPCIRGLPITVAEILQCIADGSTIEQVLAKHTELSRDDIVACLKFAADSFGDSSGGAASVPHPTSPKPRDPTAAHKKLDKDDAANQYPEPVSVPNLL